VFFAVTFFAVTFFAVTFSTVASLLRARLALPVGADVVLDSVV